MRCVDCGIQVQPRDGWTEITGFERQRAQGGTNYVADRQPTGRFLCEPCMVLRRSGIPKEQGRLT
jgi:hypothetical protein